MSASPALNMALGQLITNEVLEQRLLDAMVSVPRERCVPAGIAGAAHVDEDLPIGNDRYLLAPLTFARLLQMANIQPGDRVLDVACAYGYTTAVISKLARVVVGAECEREMAEAARRNLDAFNVSNARIVQINALAEGYSGDAPYDVIIVEGGIASVPVQLLRLLAEGGRLVAIEHLSSRPGLAGGIGRLIEYVNRDGQIFSKTTLETSAPLLPGFQAKSHFTF